MLIHAKVAAILQIFTYIIPKSPNTFSLVPNIRVRLLIYCDISNTYINQQCSLISWRRTLTTTNRSLIKNITDLWLSPVVFLTMLLLVLWISLLPRTKRSIVRNPTGESQRSVMFLVRERLVVVSVRLHEIKEHCWLM